MRFSKLISAILTGLFVTTLLGLPALASDKGKSKGDQEGARIEGEKTAPPVGTEPPSDDTGDDTDGSTDDEKD
jgi:hypothetical protein